MSFDGFGAVFILVMMMALVLVVAGRQCGEDMGRDEACKAACSAEYAWWEDGRCVCAREVAGEDGQ